MAGLGRRTHYRKHLTDSVLFDFPEPTTNEQIAKVLSTRGSNQFDLLLSQPQPTTTTTTSLPHTTTTPQLNITDQQSTSSRSVLAILPTKFRKLIWLKRNDYVIVQFVSDVIVNKNNEVDVENHDHVYSDKTKLTDDDNVRSPTDNGIPNSSDSITNATTSNVSSNTSGIRYMITHILYKEQIKHLISKGLWPVDNSDFSSVVQISTTSDGSSKIVENDNNETHKQHFGAEDQDNDDVDANAINENYNDTSDNDYESDNMIEQDDPLLFVNTNRIRQSRIIQDSDDSSDDE